MDGRNGRSRYEELSGTAREDRAASQWQDEADDDAKSGAGEGWRGELETRMMMMMMMLREEAREGAAKIRRMAGRWKVN